MRSPSNQVLADTRQNSPMQNSSQLLDKTVEQIELAFRDVNRGNGVTLHEAEVIDDGGSEAKRVKARKKDSEKRWQSVPAPYIESHYSALSFLDAEGFRYYLPAYMIWTLRNYQSSSSLTCDMTIYALMLSNRTNLAERQTEKWRLLDVPQSEAVLSFLKYMLNNAEGRADDSAAYAAIVDYWGKFERSE